MKDPICSICHKPVRAGERASFDTLFDGTRTRAYPWGKIRKQRFGHTACMPLTPQPTPTEREITKEGGP